VDWDDSNCHTDKGIKKLHSTGRWALDAAIALSPLILFLPQRFSCETLNKAWMLRLSNALGGSRPAVLFEIEANLWKSVIEIVHDPERWSNPSAWFQIPPNLLEQESSFAFFSPYKLESPPGLIPITIIQQQEDLGIAHEALTVEDLEDVNQLGKCQICWQHQILTMALRSTDVSSTRR
jgi:hypothetical protein